MNEMRMMRITAAMTNIIDLCLRIILPKIPDEGDLMGFLITLVDRNIS